MVAHKDILEESCSADDEDAPLATGLTPKQERTIVALLNEPTIKRAAETAGVGEKSIYRWMDDPKFSKVLRKARRDSFGHAIALANHYAAHAATTLLKVMSDNGAGHSARVSAAVAMLKFGREGIELDDLAARVESLEAAAAKTEKGSSGWKR